MSTSSKPVQEKLLKQPRVDRVKVTPTMAAKWLGSNEKNRAIKNSLINKYSRDIQDQRWEGLNGETIKIDWNGNVLDGQHRLKAIYQSGIPVECFVVTDLDPACAHTIDIGRSRDMSDVLYIKGEKNVVVFAAVLRLLHLYERYEGNLATGIGNKHGVTIGEMERQLEIHAKVRDSINSLAVLNSAKIMQLSVSCFLHYMFSLKSRTAADEFFHKLFTGHDLNAGSPILVLRNAIMDLSRSRGHYQQAHRLAITIKAWNAFRKGEPVKNLGYTNEEDFPKIAK